MVEFHPSSIRSKKILVIGDLILDLYLFGKINRISREAPVGVVVEQDDNIKLGGCGNAAANILALGMEVLVCGVVGTDQEGQSLIELFEKKEINTSLVIQDSSIETTRKTRVICSGQQMLRIDREKTQSPKESTYTKLKDDVLKVIPHCDGVVISDYGTGFLKEEFLAPIFALCNQLGIPTIVDPRGEDFSKYKGAMYIKPNEQEALLASKVENKNDLDAVAGDLHQTTQAHGIFITRAEKGILLFSQGKVEHFPTVPHEVVDVTGAGDTVVAILIASLSNQLSVRKAAQLANISAGIAIESLGCVTVSLDQIYARTSPYLAKAVYHQKDFPFLLNELSDLPFHLFYLDKIEVTQTIFSQWQELKKTAQLVVVVPQDKQKETALLAAISLIDYIFVGDPQLLMANTNCKSVVNFPEIAVAQK